MNDDVLELKPLPKGYLSPSQLNTYSTCPALYEKVYIEGRRKAPPGNIVNGTATHNALDHDFLQKISSQQNLPGERVAEVYADSFDKTIEAAKDKYGGVDWGEEKRGNIKDSGVAALRLYHDRHAKSINPVSVEKEMTVEFKGTSLKLLLKPDVIDQDKLIIDWKTSKMKKPVAVPPPQLGYYQLAVPEAKGLRIDGIIRTKKPDTLIQTYPANSLKLQRKLLSDMSAIEKSIRAGLFPRTGHIWGHMICRGCGFQKECWGRSVST